MPTLKARRPQANPVPQVVTVEDLTGGVDLRRSQTLLDSKRGRTYLNQSLEEPGALIVRPPYQQVSTATIFSGRPQGGARIYLASTVFTLLAGAGAVWKPDDAWASTASVYSTISSTNPVYFPFDRDLVMVMDGVNRPRASTNGSSWYLSGIDAPGSAAVVSSLSSGALSSGEYAFAYTYKHRGTAHESNGSSESTITLSGSTGAMHLEASPSTDGKVDAVVWYGRHVLPDGESVMRKISSGAASTVRVTSSAWTAADEIPTNHNAPVAGLRFAVAQWKSRWWAPSGTIGNRLYFTELFLPQAWPALFFIDIPFEQGDSITALQPLGDTLIVYGQSGAFLIIGQTALDFEVKPHAGMEAGAFGARATAKVEQASIHASIDGAYTFDGAGDRNLSFDIDPAIRDLKNVASTVLERTPIVYDGLRKEVRMAVSRVYPTGAAGEWILNLDRTREAEGTPAWTTTDRDVALYILWDGNEPTAGNRGRLFTLPSTIGDVYEESAGVGANSSNMTATYEGPGISFGLHRARVTGLHVEYEPHGGAFSAEAVVDGVSQGVITLAIGSGLYTYGSSAATYGTATYGSAARRSVYTPLPITALGRSIVTTLTYVGTERMKVFSYSPVIVPEPAPTQMEI